MKMMEKIRDLLDLFNVDYYDSGEMLIAACPAHGGDNVSAFNININKRSKFYGIWFCNTHQCHQSYGKDVLALLRILISNSKNIDASFLEVITFAQQFTSDVIDFERFEKKPRNEIVDINHKRLNYSKEDVRSRLIIPSTYYINRGFSPEILDDHDVGFCNNYGSEMYGRVVFPVYDENDEFLIGCVGRSVNPNNSIRWKNKKGFNKAKFLYNYGKALPSIREIGAIIIVEGQGDVLKLRQAGINNVVGLFGSKLSVAQEFLLQKSGALTAILATDNDEAGISCQKDLSCRLNTMFNILTLKIPNKDIGDMNESEINTIIKPQIRGLF